MQILLRDIPRVASVRTLTSCVFLSLQRGRFLRLLEKAPHLRARLEEAALRRLARSDTSTGNLTQTGEYRALVTDVKTT